MKGCYRFESSLAVGVTVGRLVMAVSHVIGGDLEINRRLSRRLSTWWTLNPRVVGRRVEDDGARETWRCRGTWAASLAVEKEDIDVEGTGMRRTSCGGWF